MLTTYFTTTSNYITGHFDMINYPLTKIKFKVLQGLLLNGDMCVPLSLNDIVGN